MRVIKRENDKVYHLVVATRWEKPTDSSQLVTYMVQQLCQDRAWPVAKRVKFEMTDYKREDHGKKLCDLCKTKAMKSKRTGPQI